MIPPGVLEIDQHDYAGLGRDAGKRDEADGHCNRHVEVEPPHQPQAAYEGEGQRQHDDERLGEGTEVEVEQQENDEQRNRDHDLQARLGTLEILELPAPSHIVAGWNFTSLATAWRASAT